MQRLSRAASYAVRAAIVAAPAAWLACGEVESNDSDDNTATNTGSGGSASTSNSNSASNSNSSSNSVAVSSGGHPAANTTVIVVNTGSTTGGEAGEGNGGSAGDIGIPIYGGPFPDMSEAKV